MQGKWANAPLDIMVHIVDKVHPADLKALHRVCRSWNQAVRCGARVLSPHSFCPAGVQGSFPAVRPRGDRSLGSCSGRETKVVSHLIVRCGPRHSCGRVFMFKTSEMRGRGTSSVCWANGSNALWVHQPWCLTLTSQWRIQGLPYIGCCERNYRVCKRADVELCPPPLPSMTAPTAQIGSKGVCGGLWRL
jgi:hypothetical protein